MKTYLNNGTKRITLAVIIICIFALVFTMALPINNFARAESSQAQSLENKIFSNVSIEDDFDENSILVVLDESTSKINKKHKKSDFQTINIESIKDLTSIENNSENNEYLNQESFRQILKLTLKDGSKQNVINAIRKLEKQEGLLWVGPNYYQKTSIVPTAATGTRYSDLWGMSGTYGIQAENAWDIATGSSNVRVGVMDTGIANHDDLNANLATGWDFINDTEFVNEDTNGHGTHVAGTIGATGANVDGVVGVNWDVELVPMRVATPLFGFIMDEWVVSALTWAVNNSIDIINFSAGGSSESVAIRDAIGNFGGLFVCAAGNGGSDKVGDDNDMIPNYPSDFSRNQSFSSRVISVGAIDENGDIATFSNYGATSVSIFAPGVDILSTISGGYDTFSGTSMATPHVTGVAALLYSKYLKNSHGLSRTDIAVQIKAIILQNSTYDVRYSGACVSAGRLNAFSSLKNIPYRTVMDNYGYNSSWYQWNGKVDMAVANITAFSLNSANQIVFNKNTNVDFSIGTQSAYNAWFEIVSSISLELKNSAGDNVLIGGNAIHSSTARVGLVSNVSYTNRSFSINTGSLANDTYTLYLHSVTIRDGVSYTHNKSFTFVVNISSSCVAEGTEITLADGSQVAVESLTGEEQLLVWNMLTGQFDTAPILFVDCDPYTEYEITHLYFSDGTEVKVIDEHGFWDFDLNEYVFLRNDASQYIGHWFNKQTEDANGNMIWTAVQLTNVDVYNEYTTAWSPVTYGYLCYYVNGMLSMPGATTGFINIFDVDATTMTIDQVAMQADIEEYGLFTYGEFAELIPVQELVFDAFNGQYLKVSIGKGLITIEEIGELFERYADFFNVENNEEIEETIIESRNNGKHNGQNKGNGKGNGHNK